MVTTQEILNALDDLEKSRQEMRLQAKNMLIKAYKQLQAENVQLKEIIKSQGNECEHRHNVLCGVKEVIDTYFALDRNFETRL